MTFNLAIEAWQIPFMPRSNREFGSLVLICQEPEQNKVIAKIHKSRQCATVPNRKYFRFILYLLLDICRQFYHASTCTHPAKGARSDLRLQCVSRLSNASRLDTRPSNKMGTDDLQIKVSLGRFRLGLWLATSKNSRYPATPKHCVPNSLFSKPKFRHTENYKREVKKG